jgi:hypothetical protein
MINHSFDRRAYRFGWPKAILCLYNLLAQSDVMMLSNFRMTWRTTRYCRRSLHSRRNDWT